MKKKMVKTMHYTIINGMLLLQLLIGSVSLQAQQLPPTNDYVFRLSPSTLIANAGDTVTVDVYLQILPNAPSSDPLIFNDGFSYGVCHDDSLFALQSVEDGNWIDALTPCQAPDINMLSPHVFFEGFQHKARFAPLDTWSENSTYNLGCSHLGHSYTGYGASSSLNDSTGGPTVVGIPSYPGPNGNEPRMGTVEVLNPGGPQILLSDPQGDTLDYFGGSVGSSGNRIVVGASIARGGEVYNPPLPGGVTQLDYCGSVFVFENGGGGAADYPSPTRLYDPLGIQWDLFGAAVAISGDTIFVGAPRKNNETGSVFVFRYVNNIWLQLELVAPNGVSGELFGHAVAISGDTLVVGCGHGERAIVFERVGVGIWQVQGELTDPFALPGGNVPPGGFGASVDVSGDTIVVGSYGASTLSNYSCGTATVFERSGGTWQAQALLLDPDGANFDKFGRSVAIDGDTIIVGTPGNDGLVGYAPPVPANDIGGAVVFERKECGNWIYSDHLLTALYIVQGIPDGKFGRSVSIQGNTIGIGAPNFYGVCGIRGLFSTFIRQPSSFCELPVCTHWIARATYTCLADVDYSQSAIPFYYCDSDDPNPIVTEDGVCYEAQPFYWLGGTPPPTEICNNGIDDDCDQDIDCADPDCLLDPACVVSVWEEIKLTPDPPGPGDNFAEKMALDDDKLVICTPLADAQGIDSGSVSIFQRDAATGGWQETQQLLPSNGSAMGHFGSSAATSANFIFIGAVGVGAAGPANGAVHVFERDATGAWAESQILEVAGASAFGTSLAVRGDLLAIGNPASSATSSDSVHLFTLDTQSGQWIELQQLIPPFSDGASFGSSIALGDGIILVGRPSDPAGLGPDTGSASVYIRDAASGSWVLEQELHSSTAQALEAFGESVAVGDGVLIISAFAPAAGPNGPSASARSFERDPESGEWLETQQLSCSSGCGAPGYQAMALEGDILVIGESQDPTPGSVTIYQRNLATCQWIVVDQLTPTASTDGDGFGTSVAISGRTIAVGAPGDDDLAPDAGAAYVFTANGLLHDCNGNGTEDQEDIASGFSSDCNGNGRPDECDIPCISNDCNSNNIPDECEEDCNGNSIPDECDIDTGFSQDFDNNYIPDECDPACMTISQETIVLNSDGTVNYSFTLTNSSGEAPVIADHLFMDIVYPPGVFITDEWQALNGLGDGDSINLSTTIIGASPGVPICFQFSIHDASLNECCDLFRCASVPGGGTPPCLDVEYCDTTFDIDADGVEDGYIAWTSTGLECCQELYLLHNGAFYMGLDITIGEADIPSSVGNLTSMAGTWCLACPEAGVTVELGCCVLPFTAPPPEFLRGDANSDGAFDISDVVSGLGYLFQGQTVPCLVALDSNDDETVDISDSIYSLEALFGGGPAPWPPYQQCGVDQTPGSLGCESFPACDENDGGPHGD